MIRVLIADDHPIVRKGLRQIVSDEAGLTVAAECGDAREALRQASLLPLDVVVLDMTMPEMSGFEALSRFRALKPDLPVLVLSAHPESEMAVRVLKAGAFGYMNKELAPEELVNAIRRVASGRKYVSAAVAEMLVQSDEHQIRLLPALPDAWTEGSVSGICARGGFVVSMEWADKTIKTVTIFARSSGKTTLISGDKKKEISLLKGQKITLNWDFQ